MMELKEGECRVYYKGKERFLPFEKELEQLFEKNGFTTKKGKWITYEEVTNDPRPVHHEEVLGVRMATRAPEVREA